MKWWNCINKCPISYRYDSIKFYRSYCRRFTISHQLAFWHHLVCVWSEIHSFTGLKHLITISPSKIKLQLIRLNREFYINNNNQLRFWYYICYSDRIQQSTCTLYTFTLQAQILSHRICTTFTSSNLFSIYHSPSKAIIKLANPSKFSEKF